MMASVDRALRLRAEALAWRVLEDETVILDLSRSRYLAVNRTGTLLWPLLAQGATRAQLTDALVERWRVDRESAAGDVDAFCAALEVEGLLEP